MQYLSFLYAVILLACVGFLYVSPMYSYQVKTRFAYTITVILMLHFALITNIKLIKNRSVKYDVSFYEDLRDADPLYSETKITPELEYFKTCLGSQGKRIFLPTLLAKGQIVMLKARSVIRINEIVSNILIDNFGEKGIKHQAMDRRPELPRLSIFRLKKLRPLVFKFQMIEKIYHNDVIVFHNVKDEAELGELLQFLAEYSYGKLFVVILEPDFKLHEPLKGKVVKCYNYDKEEFRIYLQRKGTRFVDLTNEELLELTGSDIKVIEHILDQNRKKVSKADVHSAMDKMNVEGLVQKMNQCHKDFLRRALTEYYKISHMTDEVPLESISMKGAKCDDSETKEKLLKDLTEWKIISVRADTLKFVSSAVRDGVIEYFDRPVPEVK